MTSQMKRKINNEKSIKSNFKKIKFNTIINLNNRKSIYKRQLPEVCIPFNSEEGKLIFSEALEEKNLECYFMFSMHLLTQSELTYCGLSTLCMILNALEVDPMFNWKGMWRFYSEENIRCPPHIDRDIIDSQGITLDQFSELAKYNFLEEVKLCKADSITKEEFINDIKNVSKQNREIMTLNFDRHNINQTGFGHICPLGGYNEKRRMVLLLDVARHKYPLYWVSVDLLWEAVNTTDGETKQKRGYSIVRNPLQLMKNAFILYYNYKEPIEDLFNNIISNIQDKIIYGKENINSVFGLLKSAIIQTIDQVNSIKPNIKKLNRSIFMPTYLAGNPDVILRRDFIKTINELYKEIKSSKIYLQIINKEDGIDIDLDIDEKTKDDPEKPNFDNELLYFDVLIIYVLLPTVHKILNKFQKEKILECQSLIKELNIYLEEIKNNKVINSEANFFSNSFFTE